MFEEKESILEVPIPYRAGRKYEMSFRYLEAEIL